MAKPVLLNNGGTNEGVVGNANGEVLTWNASSQEWVSLPQYYDLGGMEFGSLSVNQVLMKYVAPRPITLTALVQTGGATSKVQVNNVDASYPQSVSTSDVISVIVSVAGTDCFFTVAGKVA